MFDKCDIKQQCKHAIKKVTNPHKLKIKTIRITKTEIIVDSEVNHNIKLTQPKSYYK